MKDLKIREEAKHLLLIMSDAEHKDVVAAYIVYEELYWDLMRIYGDFDTFYDEYIKNDSVVGLKDIQLMLEEC